MSSLCEIESRSIDEIWNHCKSFKPSLKVFYFGSKCLDTVLNGVLAGEIIEFYGDSASGKTQIVISLIAQTLIEDYLNKVTRKVILIYTHTIPPLDRIKNIILNRLILLPNHVDSNVEVVNKMMKQLLISTPRDYRELYNLLTEDIFAITNGDQNPIVPSLLVIDSISIIRRIEHKESVKWHVSFIKSIARHLKKFAHERDTAIVLTNQIKDSSKTNDFGIGIPVLGSYWTRTINTRVYLHHYRISENCTRRVAKVIYSSKTSSTYSVGIIRFCIGPLGIEDYEKD